MAAWQPAMRRVQAVWRSRLDRVVAAACAAALVCAIGAAGHVRGAAPYVLRTDAVYSVDPTARLVSVTVSATFTNSTPDPAVGFSSFAGVPLSLQAGAGSVVARDAKGS